MSMVSFMSVYENVWPQLYVFNIAFECRFVFTARNKHFQVPYCWDIDVLFVQADILQEGQNRR